MNESRNTSLVFCGSEVNNDILMWSHYANCHKGVCIGFRLPTIDVEWGGITLKVNYTESIIPKKFYTAGQTERANALFYWIFTKAMCWGYEKEIRCFIENLDKPLKISNEK